MYRLPGRDELECDGGDERERVRELHRRGLFTNRSERVCFMPRRHVFERNRCDERERVHVMCSGKDDISWSEIVSAVFRVGLSGLH